MKINYDILYAFPQTDTLNKEPAPYSLFNQPIDESRIRLKGNSRKWGDTHKQTQKAIIDLIINTGKKENLSDKEIFTILAIARVESGFNPDAANPVSSAGGIGQFINKTAETYGLKKIEKPLFTNLDTH